MDSNFTQQGFLPEADPLTSFPVGSELAVLDEIEVHYGWAQQYINRQTDDPRGTGGTPYMHWLRQLIDETRAWQIPGSGTFAA
jgi:indoleamine 2,3-dioxygenase